MALRSAGGGVVSNGWGTYETTATADQRAHDMAPPPLRHALNYAVANWSAEVMLKNYREATRAGADARIVIKNIIRGMVEQDAGDTLAHYGSSHPEAAR